MWDNRALDNEREREREGPSDTCPHANGIARVALHSVYTLGRRSALADPFHYTQLAFPPLTPLSARTAITFHLHLRGAECGRTCFRLPGFTSGQPLLPWWRCKDNLAPKQKAFVVASRKRPE